MMKPPKSRFAGTIRDQMEIVTSDPAKPDRPKTNRKKRTESTELKPQSQSEIQLMLEFKKLHNEMRILSRNLGRIFIELKFLTRKIHDDERNEELSRDWKFAAMVIDRFCLIIFLSASFLSAFLILFPTNNTYKNLEV